jgi:hypothetical protein
MALDRLEKPSDNPALSASSIPAVSTGFERERGVDDYPDR